MSLRLRRRHSWEICSESSITLSLSTWVRNPSTWNSCFARTTYQFPTRSVLKRAMSSCSLWTTTILDPISEGGSCTRSRLLSTQVLRRRSKSTQLITRFISSQQSASLSAFSRWISSYLTGWTSAQEKSSHARSSALSLRSTAKKWSRLTQGRPSSSCSVRASNASRLHTFSW